MFVSLDNTAVNDICLDPDFLSTGGQSSHSWKVGNILSSCSWQYKVQVRSVASSRKRIHRWHREWFTTAKSCMWAPDCHKMHPGRGRAKFLFVWNWDAEGITNSDDDSNEEPIQTKLLCRIQLSTFCGVVSYRSGNFVGIPNPSRKKAHACTAVVEVDCPRAG